MNSKKVVKIGDVLIGGENPIAIQSMTNVNPLDEVALTKQIEYSDYIVDAFGRAKALSDNTTCRAEHGGG